MHKAFPPLEVLISKGESFNFLCLQSVSGRGELKTWQEKNGKSGAENKRENERKLKFFLVFFCFFVFGF